MDGLSAELLVADVARDRDAAPALGLHQPPGLLRVLVLVEVDHAHVRALLGEEDADGLPDSAVTPGHQRRPAEKLAGGPVPPPDVGLGLHHRLAAWLAGLVLGREGVLAHTS